VLREELGCARKRSEGAEVLEHPGKEVLAREMLRVGGPVFR
jgi:hypothetical protein